LGQEAWLETFRIAHAGREIMADNAQVAEDDGTRNPVAKFGVATFAALCAVFFPQVVLYLKHAGQLIFPSGEYVVAGAAFALVIGVITLIFEHGIRRTLAQTFMGALGVPAVLSGTLGAVGLAENGLEVQRANSSFHQALTAEGITIGPSVDAPQPQKGARFELINAAYAADTALAQAPQAQVGYSAQFMVPRYLVVLDRAPSASSAAAKVQALRQRVPDAAVVQSGSEFLVVAGSAPLSQADALSRATGIKRDGIASPSLAPVRAP
jgi:hypothetical protein